MFLFDTMSKRDNERRLCRSSLENPKLYSGKLQTGTSSSNGLRVTLIHQNTIQLTFWVSIVTPCWIIWGLIVIHGICLDIWRLKAIKRMLPTFRQFQISQMHYACIVNMYCRYAMIINLMLKCFNFQFTDSPVNTFSKTYSIS